jgi:predicted metal-dependent phosphoesterase TrpH
MIKLDLHVHSHYSEDATGSPKELIKLLRKKGLNGMAITDHNNINGSIKALEIAPENFIVIPGIEISTTDGHILALNVRKNISRKRSTEETVDIIIDEGGIPIIPHLFRNMSGIKKTKLKVVKQKINTIEVFNSCSQPKTNLKTAKIAKEYNLGGTGGSDTHDPLFAGYGYTIIDTTDFKVDTILSEIDKKKTWGEGITIPLEYRRNRMLKSIKQFIQRGFRRI